MPLIDSGSAHADLPWSGGGQTGNNEYHSLAGLVLCESWSLREESTNVYSFMLPLSHLLPLYTNYAIRCQLSRS